jgi:ubiquinol-cytochrome c reductase cytochrome b subunit
VFRRLLNWLDDRTGYRKLVSALLIEHIPGGAKWRYVWGSCLAFVFLIQVITGVLLMTAYSPADSTAWGSVYYIQYEMDFGWFIRGLHHFGSQTMVVLLAIHMLQVVIAGAHLAPREVNWWLGLLLMACVLGLSLTGYLLPWDQKGFWATQVATNIAGNLPGIGTWLQKIIVGGTAYGHHTLTRFYALHVGVLPPLVIVLVIMHLAVFRRHGITTPKDVKGEGWFWPDQAFCDMVVCLVIFGVMVGLVVYGHGHKIDTSSPSGFYDRWAHAGRDGRGANLDAPADASAEEYPARPEWYFLPLFQLLKYFKGHQEVLGTILIPNGIILLLAILPLLGRGRMRNLAHLFAVLVVVGLLVGAGALTCLAIADDTGDAVARGLLVRVSTILIPVTGAALLFFLAVLALSGRGLFHKTAFALSVLVIGTLLAASGGLLYATLKNQIPPQVAEYVSKDLTEEEKKPVESTDRFLKGVHTADKAAERALTLAHRGIPADGAGNLLRRDPMTQGPKLFQANCGSCHTHGSDFKNDKPTAPDLAGWGTEEWNLRFLAEPGHPDFFGRTKRDTMKRAIKEEFPNVAITAEKESKLDPPDRKQREVDRQDLQTLARWLARHPRNTLPDRDTAEYKKGLETFNRRSCATCHDLAGAEKAESRGPDLTGYGDEDWLRLMITSGSHPTRYGDGNAMRLFRNLEGPQAVVTRHEIDRIKRLTLGQTEGTERDRKEKRFDAANQVAHLSEMDRELIIRWLLKDDRLFGGPQKSGP